MKKNFLIVFISFIIVSCSKPKDNSISNLFINAIYLSENYNINDVNKFMTDEYNLELKKLTKEEQEITNKYLEVMIGKVKTSLSDANNEFEVKAKEDLPLDFIEKNKIIYKGNGEVFYLTSKHLKMISFFIVENEKLHSFCPDVYHSKKNEIAPYFLFKE